LIACGLSGFSASVPWPADPALKLSGAVTRAAVERSSLIAAMAAAAPRPDEDEPPALAARIRQLRQERLALDQP
jgi:hypothetical protein